MINPGLVPGVYHQLSGPTARLSLLSRNREAYCLVRSSVAGTQVVFGPKTGDLSDCL